MEWPLPRERDEAACNELARLIDALFVCVARGRGALEVSIGEALDALSVGDRVFQLGYTNIGDYARERFGLAASTAIKMARFAKALRDRPRLHEAVRAGEVSTRKAEAVMRVAVGDVEDVWVARARAPGITVRELKASVEEEQEPEPEEEKWRRIAFSYPPDAQSAVDEAMALARKAVGANAPKWKLLEAIAQEYLSGSHSADACDHEAAFSTPVQRVVEPLKELLQHELEQWASLAQLQPIAAPESKKSIDPRFLDSELRRLMGMRNGWDEVFGHLALVFTTMHGARRLDFRSFEQYCEERLGMAERTVAQRA
ncbi:MAG TPA: HNH endonuclease, partial [Myxococcales bacterium]|nr:HNH endonuclease [Myxococcales bacterium]